MIDKRKLDDALRQMGKECLKPQYRDEWTPEHPTTGYCYVVAEVIYHYCAPKGSRTYRIDLGNGDSHYFLRDPQGNVIDLTSDQFDALPDYDKGKPRPFMTSHLSKRAKKLAELLGLPKLADEHSG